MPRPLSPEVRNRVIRAWQRGDLTWQQIADRNGVSLATVRRLVSRFRRTGSAAALPHSGGRQRMIGPTELILIQRLIDEAPTRTLEQLVELFAAHTGVTPSITTMHRATRRLKRGHADAAAG